MISTTAAPDTVAALQARFGRERVAATIEGFFAAIAVSAVELGVRRIAVGGGETSGAVVTALGIEAMEIGSEIAPGVPAMFAERQGIRLGFGPEVGQLWNGRFLRECDASAGGRMNEAEMRAAIVRWGASLFVRGLTSGASGNIRSGSTVASSSRRPIPAWAFSKPITCRGSMGMAIRLPAIRQARSCRCTLPSIACDRGPVRSCTFIPPMRRRSPVSPNLIPTLRSPR